MKLEPVRTLEPVAVVNSVVALAEALVGVAVGFGAPLSKAQVGLVMAAVIAIANVVKITWARGQVTPVTLPRNNQGQNLVAIPAAAK